MNHVIEVNGITKWYESKTAVKQLNLTVKEGEVFGLLGHNGAGKSSFLESLCQWESYR